MSAARLLLAAAALLGFAAAAGADPAGSVPAFRRIMIVVLENTDYAQALEQPFLGELARRGALLTRFRAEAHPSQPNYVALVSGSEHGVTSDRKVTLSAPQIGDLLEQKGLTWKAYAEQYPGGCFLGADAGGYVRKHVPFLSFSSVQNSPERCARVVNASALRRDVADGTLPAYSLYIPDLEDSGHESGVADADRWLAGTFGPLLEDRRFTDGLLLVVTFDEDEHVSLMSDNQVMTLLIGDAVRPGSRSDGPYNHYSLLRLVEDRFGLPRLGVNDSRAAAISGIWK